MTSSAEANVEHAALKRTFDWRRATAAMVFACLVQSVLIVGAAVMDKAYRLPRETELVVSALVAVMPILFAAAAIFCGATRSWLGAAVGVVAAFAGGWGGGVSLAAFSTKYYGAYHADQPAVFAFCAAVTAGVILILAKLLHWREAFADTAPEHRPSVRFSIRDVLFCTVGAAMLLAIGRLLSLAGGTFVFGLLMGLHLASIGALVVWSAASRRVVVWSCVALVVGAAPVAAIAVSPSNSGRALPVIPAYVLPIVLLSVGWLMAAKKLAQRASPAVSEQGTAQGSASASD